MIDQKQIPPEVVEAAARGLARDSDPERFWPHFADQARAAITAALNAWPGVLSASKGNGIFVGCSAFILPLPTEADE